MYVWNDVARSLQIELALPVVERLSLEAMEAFKAVPRRGLEIGGLLLGTSRAGSITIEDYVDVPSEHRSGPSYQLSSADLEKLDLVVRSHPEAVGIYRTATQSEMLTLHRDDGALFDRYFSGRPGIFLLVHPATRTAAFCLPTADGLAIAHEFPFHPADLVTASPELESAPEPVAPAARPTAAQRMSRSRVWAARAAALLLGGVIGALAWRYLQPAGPRVRAAMPARPAVTGASTRDPGHVSLDVTRDGRTLRLHWDQQAAAIRNADHALLYIVDGNHQTNLNLSANELSNGSLSYWADTPDVTFRLEVFGPGIKTDDTIRAVSGTADLQPPAAPAAPPAAVKPKPSWRSAERTREPDDADDATPNEPSVPEERPSPFTPPPKAPEAVAMPAPHPAATPAVASLPPPSRSIPRVEVSAEPVSGSRFGRMVSHVPLLRRLKKEQEQVPAQPIHEIKPSLTAADRHNLTADVPIDVRVYVTESGAVNFAELLANRPASHHRDLAEAAVFAARRWSFRPARLGNQNVSSEVLLHFVFKPAEGPQ
jgi:hypothetical protein